MNTPRWHRPAALILAAAAALALTACGTPPRAFIVPGYFSIYGSIAVDLGDEGMFYLTGEICETGIGYSDIHLGTQVIVSDPAGATLAVGALETGTADPSQSACVFEFHIPEIPAGLGFYGLAVGNDHRGTMTYEEAEISGREILLALGL